MAKPRVTVGRVSHKHDIEVNWNKAVNFIPLDGELIIYDPDENYDYTRIKFGDGKTKVSELEFFNSGSLDGGVGETTETNGEIFNDYENNKALGEYSSASGFNTQAGVRAFKIKHIQNTGSVSLITLSNKNNIKESDVYSIYLCWDKFESVFSYHGTVVANYPPDPFIVVDTLPEQVLDLSEEKQVYIWFYTTSDTDPNSYIYREDLEYDSYIGEAAHAEGYQTYAEGVYAHAEGQLTKAIGKSAHAEGKETQALHNEAHAEGYQTLANQYQAHAEGRRTFASQVASHAEGDNTEASGYASHSQGTSTKATGNNSHAEGQSTQAKGMDSHAEGYQTVASGFGAHAEGGMTTASGDYSHAEGDNTKASGNYSHAEGGRTEAIGYYSHTEGFGTQTNGTYSHAEGFNTKANGAHSHAGGMFTIANSEAQTAIGKYNTEDANGLFIVGNGTDNTSRKNAFVVNRDGTAEVQAQGTKDNSVVTFGTLKQTDEKINNKPGQKSSNNGEIFNNYTANKAEGDYSHAEGYYTKAKGKYSHSAGRSTSTNTDAQMVIGECNIEDENALFIVGNGFYNTESYGNTPVSDLIFRINVKSGLEAGNSLVIYTENNPELLNIDGLTAAPDSAGSTTIEKTDNEVKLNITQNFASGNYAYYWTPGGLSKEQAVQNRIKKTFKIQNISSTTAMVIDCYYMNSNWGATGKISYINTKIAPGTIKEFEFEIPCNSDGITFSGVLQSNAFVVNKDGTAEIQTGLKIKDFNISEQGITVKNTLYTWERLIAAVEKIEQI